MKSNLRALIAAAAVLELFTAANDARADSKQECAAAYEKTQSLRESGYLLDARKQAVACSASTCSIYVVKDCAQWLTEIDESLPTVVFTAENAAAADPLAVRVTVDGQPITETLDGKPVPLDPGEHVVRFETPGAEAVEQKVTLQAGEKNRALTASFKHAPPPAPPSASATGHSTPQLLPASKPPPKPAPERRSNDAIPPWAWISGGAGVLALGIGAGFGVSALNVQSKLVTVCGGDPAHCPADTESTTVPLAEQRTRNRNIFLGFEAAAVVGLGAAVIGIVRSHPKPSSPRTGFIIAPFGSPSGGGVGMQGQF